jgi:DNA-binding XRE family transcriptional regulator
VRGLTQKQLASAAHLPRTYISRIENGRILPGLGTLERVAYALHVDLPALLDRHMLNRCSDACLHQSFSPFGSGRPSNGNGSHGYSNGNGHGNGNGHSNGNRHGKADLAESPGDQDFLRQMLRYTGLLTSTQRAVVLARVRQLAGARS